MIIYKSNKGYETQLGKSNVNWTEEDCYVIEDGTELATKIIQAYPYYDFKLDENGNLVDIIPLEKPKVVPEPALEDRVKATEDAINSILGL